MDGEQMTVKPGWKEELRTIRSELCGMDREQDSAAYMNTMTRLYLILMSPECIRYFGEIFRKSGAAKAQTAKEPEDYLSELWLEVREKYDPQKGDILSFLNTRIKNRIIDDSRKSSGIVGLPRDWEQRKEVIVISADQPGRNNDTSDKNDDLWDRAGAMISESGPEDTVMENLIMDAQLYELASQILNFLENRRTTSGLTKRYHYYKLFYSTDMINYLRSAEGTRGFQHENDLMEAMHFGYTRFCTDKQDWHYFGKIPTIRAIINSRLAIKGDTFPQDRVTDNNREERLEVPLENEVIRGYLERIENTEVSSPNISQIKKKYLAYMYESLRRMDLSYAAIIHN